MILQRCCARTSSVLAKTKPTGLVASRVAFSTSTPCSTPIRVKDNAHLYLHPTSTEDRYALSFLPHPPLHASSPTILGHVTSTTVTPKTFEENPEWLHLLHEILSQTCWSDEALKTQAVNREEGYLHIIGRSTTVPQDVRQLTLRRLSRLDGRNYPALNRAGEPEDIIASILCKDGVLVEGEYQPGQAYRCDCLLPYAQLVVHS